MIGKRSAERVCYAVDEPLCDKTQGVVRLSTSRVVDIREFLIRGRLTVEEALSAAYLQGIKDAAQVLHHRKVKA